MNTHGQCRRRVVTGTHLCPTECQSVIRLSKIDAAFLPFNALEILICRTTFSGCAADSRTWSAPPSDSLRPAPFWFLGRYRGRVNVGSAYRLFFGIVPLRAGGHEGLSGQYTIGATDSYNAKVTDGFGKLRRGGKGQVGKLLITKGNLGEDLFFGFVNEGGLRLQCVPTISVSTIGCARRWCSFAGWCSFAHD